MSEIWERMLSGEPYDAMHPELIEKLSLNKERIYDFNRLRPSQTVERERMLRTILGKCGENPTIIQPFYCDYGENIRVGDRFFSNFNLTILDEALVTFGDDVFIGPNVGIYTACHPTGPAARNSKVEWALPVTIGNSVWIGGGVTILPGVTIGDNCTIGAGSVVVHDISANSIAVGNPCRVIRSVPKSSLPATC